MRYFLMAFILAACSTASITAVEIPTNIDRVAVPNGTFPIADYWGVVPGKTLQLTVTAPPSWTLLTADCSGGGDSPWRTINVALFKAFIKPSYRGLHAGSFNGTMVPTGTGTGTGPSTPVPWDGKSTANVIQILHTTVLTAADGSPNDRTDVGVNEQVTFSTDPSTPANWRFSAGEPLVANNVSSVLWTAPITASSVVVMAVVNGKDYTISMRAWAPYSAQWKRRLSVTTGYTAGRAGAQMRITDCTLEPSNVNFTRIQRREMDNAADGVSGWFSDPFFTTPVPPSTTNRLYHSSSGQWISIVIQGGKNMSTSVDTAGYDPPGLRPTLVPGGFTAGGYNWNIPYEYRSATNPGGGIQFTTVRQNFKMTADGTMTVVKDDDTICRVTRSPNQP